MSRQNKLSYFAKGKEFSFILKKAPSTNKAYNESVENSWPVAWLIPKRWSLINGSIRCYTPIYIPYLYVIENVKLLV